MRRTRRSAPSSLQSAVAASFSVQSALFSPPSSDTIDALFAPLHYTSGYAYPLIVWLHGPGGDERQLMRIMPPISMQNYVAVAPRGLLLSEGANDQAYGWQQTEDQTTLATNRSMVKQKLTTLRLKYLEQEIILEGAKTSLSLGRDKAGDVVIIDRMASRQHGKIERRLDKFVLADHSANGTYVTVEGESPDED